jgi:copper(I)-binding protein
MDVPTSRYQLRLAVLSVLLLMCASVSAADIAKIDSAWVGATVPGQSVAAAYMNITARTAAALTAIQTPIAAKSELHNMTMDRGVMKMRPASRIELPAGKTVSLKPGGYHAMLIDLKHPLKPGERVALTLTMESQGVKSTQQIDAEVRAVGDEMHAH